MGETMTTNETFAEQANPHAWLLVADDLHSQALELKSASGAALTHVNHQTGEERSWLRANRSMFLLGGFALENLIKAFLVYENPEWVSKGSLARNLKSHGLTKLATSSRTIPVDPEYAQVLRRFEAGLESWARYPCALTAQESNEPAQLDQGLWIAFLNVVRAYGHKLQSHLANGWKGPHGCFMRFEVGDDFCSWS